MREATPVPGASRGIIGIAFAGALIVVVASIAILIAIAEGERLQQEDRAAKDTISSAKAIVLDYARKNGSLPSVSTFNSLTAGMKDPWGNPLYYFPATSLTAGISGASTTPISVLTCFSDIQCATYLRIDNVPFLIVSPGQVVYSASSPIAQTTQLTASAPIATQTFFKTYNTSVSVGPHEDSNTASRFQKYDDRVVMGTLQETFAAAATLSKTLGDVQNSGGDLKILNTSPLPGGTCGTAYSKALSAYGKDSGVFSWSFTGLPAGLSAAASTTKNVTISGTPTEDGTFSVIAGITDPNARQSSKTFSLTIVSPGWSDTGSTRSSSCSSGLLGAIQEKQQSNSCGSTQWVTTSSTCVNTATADLRLRGSTLIAAGASSSSTNTGDQSLNVGAGTAAFTISAASSSGTAANLSREASASTSNAVGVIGGASTYINPGESITITLSGGSARTMGLEFYGFGVNTTGTDKIEEAIVTFKNTTTGVTVGTYTLEGCQSDSTNTQRSTFFLPDPGNEFNQIKITAGSSPSNTDFMVRSFRTCGVGTSCTPSNATATTCPYP